VLESVSHTLYRVFFLTKKEVPTWPLPLNDEPTIWIDEFTPKQETRSLDCVFIDKKTGKLCYQTMAGAYLQFWIEKWKESEAFVKLNEEEIRFVSIENLNLLNLEKAVSWNVYKELKVKLQEIAEAPRSIMEFLKEGNEEFAEIIRALSNKDEE